MNLDKNKKLNIYKLLGAEKFQKVVFKVEDIKFKIIDKFFPNIYNWYDKYLDKITSIKIKMCKKNDEKNKILEEAKLNKLLFKKELVYKQNRNYHYNKKYPTEFIEYLNLNKKIHMKSLIWNIVIFLGLIIYSLTPLPKSILFLDIVGGFQIISAVINFECINLQNYNLCRFEDEIIKKKLEKNEQKGIDRRIKEKRNFIGPIANSVIKNKDIPTVDNVLENITTKEQITDLLKYTKKQLEEIKRNNYNNNQEENYQKKLGGK